MSFFLANGVSANELAKIMYEYVQYRRIIVLLALTMIRSPLPVACILELIEIDRLLTKGACVNHVDLSGFTAYQNA
jgi:hypothetical protein